MNKTQEALKMAIDFIEDTFVISDASNKRQQDILEACKEALAEPQEQSAEIAQYKAQINELREALEKVIFHAEFRAQDEDTAKAAAIGQLMVIEELANEYLAKTAPQSLQEHDNKVIERCAKVADEYYFSLQSVKAIRALKGKQNEI